MRLAFGRDSYAEPQTFTWNMWYVLYHKRYVDEPGLLIHLSPADARAPRKAIEAALGAASGALAPVLGALATVLPSMAGRLTKNSTGGMDIRMSEHGFQVNRSWAADPNVFLGAAWRPVALALASLAAAGPQAARLDLASEGDLVAAAPLTLSDPAALDAAPGEVR